MGRGAGVGNPLVNSTPNSLAIGFNSTIPTLFVDGSSGPNTTGNVSIGTTTPVAKLTVNSIDNTGASIVSSNNFGGLVVKTIHTNDFKYNTYIDVNRDNTKALAVINEGTGPGGKAPRENFLVWGDGRTQIGYEIPQNGPYSNAKLTVAGTITAKEVYVVNSAANWADYVFDNTYKLKSLGEVEQYVKQNKHLPNIPSAEEIKQNGQNISQLQILQMEKIEELTLYMIEMQKQIKILQEENKLLKQNKKAK